MEILRYVRTKDSECYLFFENKKRIGLLELHYQKHITGTLILEHDFSDDYLQTLIERIDHEILTGVEQRDDFILSVYKGEEIGFYSDTVTEEDRKYEPAKAKDIEHVSSLIKSVLGKTQTAKGKLSEYIAVEFFRKLGYKAERGGNDLDHKKLMWLLIKMGSPLMFK